MSTWISRALIVLAAGGLLAACQPGATGGQATRSIAVMGGALTIAGPAGYCIDRTASRSGPDGAFVLLGSCASLGRSLSFGSPRYPAVLTVSILPGAPEAATFAQSFDAIDAFFRSEAGRRALARSGEAAKVAVLQSEKRGDVLFLRVRDQSQDEGRRVEPEYWRAIFALRGQIVTASALSVPERPVPQTAKRRILEELIARLVAANPVAKDIGSADLSPEESNG
ncbi:hypothetical protein LV82_00343 [Albidovulum inexpectatum]|uniref:Cation transport ATPase n=1 Tax=Albidovulum inexpectatum TaxID=196587 RepID=A0A2S5JLX1_9RHOB|nr:hypothetical protein [Albidovulum inexpectatum]PPB82413.1 hypothetical protein LV82_00343 [Albidovulum inexpectatum]